MLVVFDTGVGVLSRMQCLLDLAGLPSLSNCCAMFTLNNEYSISSVTSESACNLRLPDDTARGCGKACLHMKISSYTISVPYQPPYTIQGTAYLVQVRFNARILRQSCVACLTQISLIPG